VASITLSLSAAANQTISVQYQTSGGSGLANVDYRPVSGTVTFNVGQTSQTFTVPILDDGGLGEANATIGLSVPLPEMIAAFAG